MYTKKFVNITSLIIAIVISLITNFFLIKIPNSLPDEVDKQIYVNEVENGERENIVNNQTNRIEEKEEIIGKIKIPKINLEANIKEGTSSKIIDYYVGHFEDTSLNEGNIGLAAHNRGEKVKAYFKDIKKLQEGDEIIYETKEIKRIYKVKTITIIKQTNWTYLQPTDDNRITLITCVENEPEYRLCVQAIED